MKIGAEIDIKDNDGWTPLLDAALNGNFDSHIIWTNESRFILYSGHENVVDILIKNGADVNATVVDGKTALYLAALNGMSLIWFFKWVIKLKIQFLNSF